jgi:hypothetical protein
MVIEATPLLTNACDINLLLPNCSQVKLKRSPSKAAGFWAGTVGKGA